MKTGLYVLKDTVGVKAVRFGANGDYIQISFIPTDHGGPESRILISCHIPAGLAGRDTVAWCLLAPNVRAALAKANISRADLGALDRGEPIPRMSRRERSLTP